MYLGYPSASTGKVSIGLVPGNDTKNRAVWTLLPAATPQLSGYCVSGTGVPEQINLQVASPDAVVISFVTFEAAEPTNPPTATVTTATTATSTTHTGMTHMYETKGGRKLYMHFIAVHGLTPRATYTYVVQSGSAEAKPSSQHAFHALPDGTTPTRINIYGDLGVYVTHALRRSYMARLCSCTAVVCCLPSLRVLLNMFSATPPPPLPHC